MAEAGQKDKLTYVSLVHQRIRAKLMGYTDQKIISAVISSMFTSLTLQTVLETTLSLSLERLEQFMEAHFQQQYAHDLCNTM